MTKKDKNTIDMPEVSDIPGQEHIRPPRLGELADGTASSADEEGDDVLGPLDSNDGDLRMDNRSNVSSNVSKDERATLASIDRRSDNSEDEPLRSELLDSTDEDGTPLNEKSFGSERNDDLTSEDLDIPGVGDDDADRIPGEEDEENEDYSLSDNNDDDDDREINTDL